MLAIPPFFWEPGFTPLIKWWISQPAILVYWSVTFWKVVDGWKTKVSPPRKNPMVDRTVTRDQVFPNHGQREILQQVGCEATCWKLERLVGYTRNTEYIYIHIFLVVAQIFIYLYMIPVRGSLPHPPPPHMVWSQNLRFAAFRMKTLYLQCFLHGGLLARSANLQIRWNFATNLPKTCYLQCFGFDIVE